jgi:subtilisin family serine protease
MPPGSDPNKILTDALNPGLGVRQLHQQGITGKGVNVAIIDQPTYRVHPEFAGKIVAYHDTGCETDESSMHGPLVASLLVGTNCGTAPDARVYYAAVPTWKMDAAYYAKGLDWIIAQNEKLPQEEKIRVVSVSASPNQSSWANRQMWDEACDRADEDGIMVLDCTDDSHRGFIDRCWYNARAPESVAQCNPWSPPNTEFRFNPRDTSILVPSSPRTAAEDGGVPGYQYAGRGGLSRAIPYCAGVLAMGWQINPEIGPQQMRELLFESAYTKSNGAKIIDPKKFILLARTVKAVPRQNQRQKISREHSKNNTIVPGLRVGDYKLGMSKDEVLKRLRKTKGDSLREAGNSISVDGVILYIIDDSVKSITVLSPLYKFANGLGVGDSEKEFKQAFGLQFTFEEDKGKLYLTYKDEGLQFIIHKKKRTVMEFTVTNKISRRSGDSLAKPIESVKPYDDVRWKDLSKLDLSTKRGLINTLTFNKKTVWPEQAKMPLGSGPQKILTDAMNPGLGVRQLHQQGITGKGVNVAIIDQPTYLVHPEFAGKIVAYHDTGCETDDSSMHGPAVASLLVGTNCGTAPGARVYYAAAPSWKRDAAYYAKGLDWIIAQNKKLPQGEKIRVVSVSASPNQSSWANRQMWDRACARAEADGIMVLDCTDSRRRGFIGRCWYNARAPESVAQCNPWAPPNREFRGNPGDLSILVPAAPRTTAEDGEKDKLGYRYQYWGRGGLSWSIPYCAGVLAMGWQVNPKLSPEQIRELLFKSAYTKRNGAKIIYPRKFVLFVKRTAPRTN